AAMVALAAAHAPPRARRLRDAAGLVALGLGLSAVWLLPLLAHLDMALPLAWQDLSIGGLAWRLIAQPIVIVMAVLTVAGWRLRRRDPARPHWLLALAPLVAGLVALDALALEPLGIAWLPADRVMDGLYWALVVGGALGFAVLVRSRARPAVAALVALAACLPLSWGAYEPGLSLWPGSLEWPKEALVARGLRMDAVWEAIGKGPSGRVLFLRSGVPLDWRPEWWRPHTHITALTPIRTGRGIVGGTFTHPSPVAGLFYTGSAANRSLTRLAEELDGESLLGRPLDSLDPARFDGLLGRLGVSTVVALDQDARRSPFLLDNQAVVHRTRIGPFIVFDLASVPGGPRAVGFQRWRVGVTSPATGGWAGLPIAYSPLWIARAGGAIVPVRRDHLGLVEVAIPTGATEVELEHRAGAAEWAGAGLSLLSLVLLGLVGVRRAGA
ncbi:MAG TPA: hypothetical protein VFT36_03485, partial [Methylomirabilota bacterium]|nr:hypothetical protein [Methylomirabilota bacterium]